MNERVKDEQQRIAPGVGSNADTRRSESLGIGVRIDPAHHPSGETEAKEIAWPNLEHFVRPRADEPSSISPAVELADDVLSNRSGSQSQQQFLEEIKVRNANLERREQELRARILSWEEDRLQFNQRIARDQSQLEAAKLRLQQGESALAERMIAFEVQSRKVEAEFESLQQQRLDLERHKKQLRDELLAELHADRAEIANSKAALQQDIEHAQVLKDALQARLDSHAADNDRILKTEREKLWKSLTEEWEQRERTFQSEREEWAKTRDLERSELDREKAMFESAAETANAEFIQSRQLLEEARQSLEQELAAARDQHQATIEATQQEWEQTRQQEEQLLRNQIESTQAEIIAVREALAIELDSSRVKHEAELNRERDEWNQFRLREETELRTIRSALDFEIRTTREQHEAAIHEERTAWEQQRDQEQARQDAQRSEWAVNRDAMLAASREALEIEFIELRAAHAAMLQADRDEWEQTRQKEEAALEEQRIEFLRERTLIENRIRFQQEHLEKSRAEFEQAQNDYRRERQIESQRLEDINASTLRRMKQLDLYRSSIDAREKSLDREQEVFNKTRKAINSTADFDRLNFQAERHAWEQERQLQQNDLLRQQEALAARTETVESRRLRLDKLRAELEETHRGTLEMRLAVEESWAQLTHVAGEDDARKRVEQVRQSLAGYYQQMHESLADQRREHVELQSRFERQRAEFADERQKLTAWITKRDEELRVGEERLRLAANDAALNHTKWLNARDRWLMEKAEAEQLIRRLISSLGDNNREQIGHDEALQRLDEISGAA